MRTFLQTCFLFGAGAALLFLGLLAAVLALDGRPPAVVFNRPVDTVVIGDSHVQCAVDDSALPGVANLALDSEGYIFSYAKIRFLFQQHPEIHRVILGFGVHNLSSYYEEGIWGNKSGSIVRRYTELLTAAEKAAIIRHNPATLADLGRGMSSARLATMKPDGRVRFIGAFEPMDTGKPTNEESILKRIRSQYYVRGRVVAFSAFQRRYLDQIVQLCREQGKTLVLLNTPVHPEYWNLVPAVYKAEYDALVRSYGVKVVDFHDQALPNECFLPDGDHVNRRGVQRVTEYLANYLHQVQPAGGNTPGRAE